MKAAVYQVERLFLRSYVANVRQAARSLMKCKTKTKSSFNVRCMLYNYRRRRAKLSVCSCAFCPLISYRTGGWAGARRTPRPCSVCGSPRLCRRRERCLVMIMARFGRWPLAWRKIWAVSMFDLAPCGKVCCSLCGLTRPPSTQTFSSAVGLFSSMPLCECEMC